MTAGEWLLTTPLSVLPVEQALSDDDLKRLPPLFYESDSDIESLLVVHKLVSVNAPTDTALEVYLYEHEAGVFAAILMRRSLKALTFTMRFIHTRPVQNPRRFVLVERFKARTIGELLDDAERDGLTISESTEDDSDFFIAAEAE